MLYQRCKLNLVVCLALLFTAAGASADDGKLSGTITLNGKPLPGVRVTFHLDKGEFVGTTTTEEGEYTVSRVPIGVRKITVKEKVCHLNTLLRKPPRSPSRSKKVPW
jgi:hypothetical protein